MTLLSSLHMFKLIFKQKTNVDLQWFQHGLLKNWYDNTIHTLAVKSGREKTDEIQVKTTLAYVSKAYTVWVGQSWWKNLNIIRNCLPCSFKIKLILNNIYLIEVSCKKILCRRPHSKKLEENILITGESSQSWVFSKENCNIKMYIMQQKQF